MTMKYGVQRRIATFGIALLWTANTLIPAIADSQSISNDNTAFEKTTTSPSVSEPLPTIVNEPSFSSKTTRPEPTKGAIQISDPENVSLCVGLGDGCEHDRLDLPDSDGSSAELVEESSLSESESSDVYDRLQGQGSNLTPNISSMGLDQAGHGDEVEPVAGSASQATYLEAENISIPSVNVVDSGVSHPSLLRKSEVPEHFEYQRNDLDHEVSQVTTLDDDFDDRSLLDVFGEVAKEYLTQRVVRFS
jgi:hypothetical protein